MSIAAHAGKLRHNGAGQTPADKERSGALRAHAQRRAEWATAWLHSEDPLRVAWGAWLAKQDHATALTSLLVEMVEEYQPPDSYLSQPTIVTATTMRCSRFSMH